MEIFYDNPTARDLEGLRTIEFFNNVTKEVTIERVIHKTDGTPLWLKDNHGRSYPWTSIISIV